MLPYPGKHFFISVPHSHYGFSPLCSSLDILIISWLVFLFQSGLAFSLTSIYPLPNRHVHLIFLLKNFTRFLFACKPPCSLPVWHSEPSLTWHNLVSVTILWNLSTYTLPPTIHHCHQTARLTTFIHIIFSITAFLFFPYSITRNKLEPQLCRELSLTFMFLYSNFILCN